MSRPTAKGSEPAVSGVSNAFLTKAFQEVAQVGMPDGNALLPPDPSQSSARYSCSIRW